MNVKNVRIKDIAQLAGVSAGTVDRVLHNRGRVSSEALKKVMAVIDQIDYKPNLIVRSPGPNKTIRVATITPNPHHDPYWASTQSGIRQAEAEWLRYGVSIEQYFFNLYDKDSFGKMAEEICQADPDGVLIAPVFYRETTAFFKVLESRGIPYSLFNTSIPETNSVSFVGQDLHQSGKIGGQLMQFALQGESGKIGVLHINEDLTNAVHLAEKENGFRDYIQDNNLPFEIVTHNLCNPVGAFFESQLSAILSDDDLRGVFVSTSKATYIVASFLERLNQRHIKLIGYDMLQQNIHYMKKGIIQFLINQNPKQQASLGLNHLLRYLVLKKESPSKYLLPLEIISRENFESYLNV